MSNKVALVSMPWASLRAGSIALGILKRVLRRSRISADIYYLNLLLAKRMNLHDYDTISQMHLIGDWLFSQHLFGEYGSRELNNSYFDVTGDNANGAKQWVASVPINLPAISKEIIPRFLDECFESVDWSQYSIVGFTSVFVQNVSSLLLSQRIKDRFPDIKIVLGGANVEGPMGLETLRAFEWIDYVVDGEAEENFPHLVRNIFSKKLYESVPGVSFRQANQIVCHQGRPPMTRMNRVPIPDYSDFFRQLEDSGLASRVPFTDVMFESARGCWWGEKSHCTFCGLNGQSMKFRSKSPRRVLREVFFQSRKYQRLDFEAVDNILDWRFFSNLLPQLAQKKTDMHFFFEVKSNLSKAQVNTLQEAGIRSIQPGIESLHTEVLTLMRKGVTAIQNIQLLKWCAEKEIDVVWNLLYGFPGENADHYRQILNTMTLIYHYQPPETVNRLMVQRFSPYFFDPDRLGIRNLKPLEFYSYIYPDSVKLSEIAYSFDYCLPHHQQDPETYIGPVRERMHRWKQSFSEKKTFFRFRKGKNFIELLDNRPLPNEDRSIRRTLLNDLKSIIFEFCDPAKSLREIYEHVKVRCMPKVQESDVMQILEEFVQRGFMYQEGKRYLNLALPA
jgi:ribosomal peptide maturation radical SAM protein 1